MRGSDKTMAALLQRSRSESKFPPLRYQSESGSVRIPFQPAQAKTNWTNNHHSLEVLLKNSGIRSAHGMATLLRHRRTKGRLFGDWIKSRTMWAFVEKSKMTGSVGNLDIIGIEWYVRSSIKTSVKGEGALWRRRPDKVLALIAVDRKYFHLRLIWSN